MDDEFEILAMLQEALSTGVVEIPECKCVVEYDGICEHGNRSPLLEMEMI